jgi:hypothetical protein
MLEKSKNKNDGWEIEGKNKKTSPNANNSLQAPILQP